MDLLDVYKRMGLEGSDALVTISSNMEWKNRTSFPSRVYRLLERNDILSSLKAFFFYDNKPLILFFENPDDSKAIILKTKDEVLVVRRTTNTTR